uniref:DNA dC->dU-editing enzyme APOBEC-3G n=1 Tax=Myotis lucifugus TaxID=59463 RepID=G1Q326_MYOLU
PSFPPACAHRPLMDPTTFEWNFGITWAKETYLCYEVEVREGDAWVPAKEHEGFLRNEALSSLSPVLRHAELCFLRGVSDWDLDEGKQYRLTYMSWSPCPNCAPKLVEFLDENSHVTLRIFPARIHTKSRGYQDGLRNLRDAGAQLAIMTLKEHQHCWDTFVDNQGQPFRPWPNLVEHIETKSQELKDILRLRFLPPAPPSPSLPGPVSASGSPASS